MLNTFDMNLLLVFHTLMEERSVTRTGDRLGKTQSAISNALKRLREQFDDPLFVRTPNGLAPTPRAVELGRAVVDIVQITETCLVRDRVVDPGTAKVHFALGAPDRLSLPVILPFLETLRHEAPGISIDIRTADRDLAIRLLEEQAIDLALGWFDQLPRQFSTMPAFSEELVCLARTGHPLFPKKGTIPLDQLLAWPHLVVTSGGSRKAAFDMSLARRGLQRIAHTSVSNFTMVPSLLLDSDLVGVFTRRTADYFARHYDLTTCPLPLEFEGISHRLVWHRRFDADPLHVWFRQQLSRHWLTDDAEADTAM